MAAIARIAALACLAGLALAGSADMAAAQDGNRLCDGTYTVKAGDTLSELARRTFGRSAAFPSFYDDPRNREALGPNPNLLSIGTMLHLPPCETEALGELQEDTDQDSLATQIDIVTASDFAPFTDEGLPSGGMLTRIVHEAFSRAGIENPVSIDFVNDWGSHLDTLLPKMKYAFGFPWYRPDCTNPDALSPAMAERCELVWSEPLFTVSIFLYGPSLTDAAPESFSDLEGRALCRPSGYFTFDLEQNGLYAGKNYTLRQPTSVIECFRMLERGEVDFVSLNRFTAEKAIAEAGLTDLVAPLPALVSSQTLHLVAHPFNGDAQRWMQAFDEGLRDLKRSGRYSQVANRFRQIHEQEVREIAENL